MRGLQLKVPRQNAAGVKNGGHRRHGCVFLPSSSTGPFLFTKAATVCLSTRIGDVGRDVRRDGAKSCGAAMFVQLLQLSDLRSICTRAY